MKSSLFSKVLSIVFLFGILGFPSFAGAGDDMPTEEVSDDTVVTAAPMTDEEMKAKWKEYSTPGENHRVLDQFVGNWDYTVKMWVSPEAPAEESVGTSEAKWTMDGRFLQQNAQGQSMGQPFSGIGITGYDNARKEYIGVWYDNMGTGIMIGKGDYEAATKTLTQGGKFVCPLKGKMDFRWVTKIIDENSYVFECYMSSDEAGKEFKGMEITYKRK